MTYLRINLKIISVNLGPVSQQNCSNVVTSHIKLLSSFVLISLVLTIFPVNGP